MVEITNYVPARPYAACSRAGNMLFLAGETGSHPETREVADGIEAQTEQALANIRHTLERVGSGLEHVVRLTVYLTDIADLKSVSQVRRRVLPGPVPSATVGISALARPEMLVEIEATAVVPD